MALWVRGKCIGNGSFGSVNVAVNKSDGAVFAVKSVEFDSQNRIQSLENEIRILRSLSNSSPYVVKYLGDDVSAENLTTYRNLHMEYMPGGTLADTVKADVDESTIKSYTFCLVSALKYLHSRGIVHCDVKGKNVLVGRSVGYCKLADFGSVIDSTCNSTISPRGSPLWMAPEVIRGDYQGPESDVWSIGCTIIEMFTGKPGWEDQGFDSLSQIAFSTDLPEFPAELSDTCRDFLEKCFRRDKSQRWSCEELLQHPFISSVSPSLSTESSPRCVLDWVNSEFDETVSSEYGDSARERISKLATMSGVNWEFDEGWLTFRNYSDEERAEVEFCNLTRTEEEEAEYETARINSVYSDSVWIKLEFRKSGVVWYYSCKVGSTDSTMVMDGARIVLVMDRVK
ncbi:hypothetical protein ACFE04_013558 [Oxalis oulophora]